MDNLTRSGDDAGRTRRFDVELLIRHPSLDPAEITSALGLAPTFVQRVGDRRQTPDGVFLEGEYRDTRWRFSVRHETRDQWFAAEVSRFLDLLTPNRDFLVALRSRGGEAQLIIQLLDDEYYGDDISRDTLARIVDLHLDLGLESFGVRQA